MTVSSVGDTSRSIAPPKAKKVKPETVKSDVKTPSVPEIHGEYIEIYEPVIAPLPKIVIEPIVLKELKKMKLEGVREEIDVEAIVRENGERIDMRPLIKLPDNLPDLKNK
jgi:hypothetical protein